MSPDTLNASTRALRVSWPDGTVSTFAAEELRRAARDAVSLRQMYDAGKIAVPEGLEITGVDYVGAYAVNVRFSDGHDRAIFPFVYLRELRGLTTS